MHDKKLTDNEIIKAFAEHYKQVDKAYSDHLAYGGKGDEHEEKYIYMLCDALDLINRQKADNINLKGHLEQLKSRYDNAKAEIERLKAELGIKNLTIQGLEQESILHNETIAEEIELVKAEAVKEFAEQLDAEIESSDKYIREYDDSEVQKAYNKGLRDALKVLKELVGE